MANPLAAIFTQVRHAVIDPEAPTAADVDRRRRGGCSIPLAVVAADLRARALGLHARGAADRRGPVSDAATRCARGSTRSSASTPSRSRGRTTRSPRPRTAATGSTAGTSTSTPSCERRGAAAVPRRRARRREVARLSKRLAAAAGRAPARMRAARDGARLMASVSVVIPVKDGAERLGRAARRAAARASRRGARDRLRARATARRSSRAPPGAEVLEIAPEEFGHGRTRNLGAERTSGELICFLTQDAVPLPGWLDAYRRGLHARRAGGRRLRAAPAARRTRAR